MSVLITGGGAGIGRATARRLARTMRVIVADIDGPAVHNVADEINADGGEAVAYQLDVTKKSEVDGVVARETDHEPITGLFTNAGINVRKRVEDITVAEWRSVMDVHVKGSYLCARAVLPEMRRRRAGAIVTMSSDYAVIGSPHAPAYASAKAAVYSFTKSLALEVADDHIRVNAVGPGPIDTGLLRNGRTPDEWHEMEKKLVQAIPMDRLGEPDEVASVVAFLLSERAAYITGQIIHPNGGRLTW